jgi:hypothetical protein
MSATVNWAAPLAEQVLLRHPAAAEEELEGVRGAPAGPRPAPGRGLPGGVGIRPGRLADPGVAGFMVLGVIYMIYLYWTNPGRITDVGLVHLEGDLG